MKIPSLEFADIILVRGDHLLGKFIRWGERGLFKSPGRVNHVAGVIDPIRGIEVEALWHVEAHKINKFSDGETKIAIYRATNIPLLTKMVIANEVYSKVGMSYNPIELITHLIDNKIFLGHNVLQRFTVSKSRWICSRLWAHVYANYGYTFGKDANLAEPDDIDTYVRNSKNYECIHELGPWLS